MLFVTAATGIIATETRPEFIRAGNVVHIAMFLDNLLKMDEYFRCEIHWQEAAE